MAWTQAAEITAQADGIAQQIVALEQQIQQLPLEAETLRTQAAEERTLAGQEQQQAAELQQQAAQLQQQADDLAPQIAAMQEQKAPLDQQNQQLLQEIAALQGQIDQKQQQIAQLQGEIDSLNGEIPILTQQAGEKEQQAQVQTQLAQARNQEANQLQAQADQETQLAQEAQQQADYYAQLAQGQNGPQVVTYFFYSEGGQLLGEYDETGSPVQETIYLGNIPVELNTNNNLYAIHTDHLGTPRVITDADQQVVWRWESDPFGIATPDEDPDGDGTQVTYNLRFPGQYYDQETGRHYNYFRDYDPRTGRYVESDPIGLEGGLNTYAYVDSSPLMWIDQKGLLGNKPPPGPDRRRSGLIFGDMCGSGESAHNIPDRFYIYDFRGPCAWHDLCYGCSGARAGFDKSSCDNGFFLRMIIICASSPPSPPFGTSCFGMAVDYYISVIVFGKTPYDQARKNCCRE